MTRDPHKKPADDEIIKTIETNEAHKNEPLLHDMSKEKKTGRGEEKNQETPAQETPVMGLESNKKDNQNKVPLKTIDQLLIHNSDTAVKPIIGNKDIEKHAELIYNA